MASTMTFGKNLISGNVVITIGLAAGHIGPFSHFGIRTVNGPKTASARIRSTPKAGIRLRRNLCRSGLIADIEMTRALVHELTRHTAEDLNPSTALGAPNSA